MGLAEYIKAGAALERAVINLQTDVSGSGSVNLGSAYVLLGMTTTAPCRLRLYDTIQGRDDAAEKARIFSNTNISASTALVGDFTMSVGTYTIDPVVYGVVQNTSTPLTYYRVDNTASGQFPQITFNRYLLEDPTISSAGRRSIPPMIASLAANGLISGTLYDSQIPTTYLLVSASVSGSATRARLRLYSTSQSFSDTIEVNRLFATESSATSKLIVDIIMSGSETTYFIPKIIGANFKNTGTDLNLIRNNIGKIMGANELYYILQNASTTGGTVAISASVHLFSFED
jgi:hypothetical protein